MKILFIYKYTFYQPLGIMYLSSALKQNGHLTDFIDLQFEKNLIKSVNKIKPDIICYSIPTGPHNYFKSVNNLLKSHFNFLSVFGGHYCTFIPEFIDEEGVDIIIRGEAENVLPDIANALQNKKSYTNTLNTWVKADGKIYKNDFRNITHNLDEICFPDRELLDKYPAYKKSLKRSIIASRGCPNRCSYCWNGPYSDLIKGKGINYRRRSIDNVMIELKEILKSSNKLRIIRFWDDNFIVNKEWTLKFCDAYKKNINFPFRVFVHIDNLDEEIIMALREAGCVLVDFAKESGNEQYRKDVLQRGNYSNEKLIKASLMFKKHGIRTMSLNITCLPDETMDMAYESITLNIHAKVTYSYSTIFQPYPGTSMLDYCVKKGYFDGDIENIKKSYIFHGSPLKIDNKKEKERLHFLFAYAVAFPFLFPVIKLLIKLPFNFLYKVLFITYKFYNYSFTVFELDKYETYYYLTSFFYNWKLSLILRKFK